MKKGKQAKEQGDARQVLQARVLLRTSHGELFDVTQDEHGYGLKSLGQMGRLPLRNSLALRNS